jgi:hypothetical protein
MNDELESIWKEATVAQLRYYPSFCLEGQRENMNTGELSVSAKIRTTLLRKTQVGSVTASAKSSRWTRK